MNGQGNESGQKLKLGKIEATLGPGACSIKINGVEVGGIVSNLGLMHEAGDIPRVTLLVPAVDGIDLKIEEAGLAVYVVKKHPDGRIERV